jgi:hypothetical protein
MGYALVKKDGSVWKTGSVSILEIEKGDRISYQTDRPIKGPLNLGKMLHLHCMGCKAKIVQTVACSADSECWYDFEVVGTNPSKVEKVIELLEHLLGVKDLTREQLPKLPELFLSGLPKLGSAIERIRFLWNYIVHGEIA